MGGRFARRPARKQHPPGRGPRSRAGTGWRFPTRVVIPTAVAAFNRCLQSPVSGRVPWQNERGSSPDQSGFAGAWRESKGFSRVCAKPLPVARSTSERRVEQGGGKMARLTIADAHRQLDDPEEIRAFLESFGIRFETWDVAGRLGAQASNEEILSTAASGSFWTPPAGRPTMSTTAFTKATSPSAGGRTTFRKNTRAPIRSQGCSSFARGRR